MLIIAIRHLVLSEEITTVTSQTPPAPSTVLSFKVMSISTTAVKLHWEPFPLFKQEGLVLYYQIGVDQKENGNHHRSGLS